MPSNKIHLANYAIAAQKLDIKKHDFPKASLDIITRLEEKGFQGFIVGGAIRDLLCGISPKDFDIATDATPEQVHSLFKNSRIIGRRFKIVHIFFGREIFEIATFRRGHDKQQSTSKHCSHVSHSGQLLGDNVYGDIKEDASRRDFTCNALYYSTSEECIYDFCNALADIKNKQLRLIGEVKERYIEDPVRMLRAIRFSHKLQFTIEKKTSEQILKNASAIKTVSHARLFDETIKLFHNGYALGIYQDMKKYTIFQQIYPSLNNNSDHDSWSTTMIETALENTSDRISQNKPITIAYLYAVLLWPIFLAKSNIKSGKRINLPHIGSQALALIREQSKITCIPKRHAYAIKDIWEFQVRLQQQQPNKIQWILQHKRFRASFDFLLLREIAQEFAQPSPFKKYNLTLGEWWEKIQFADESEQQYMIQELKKNSGFKKLSRKKPKPTK